MRQTFVCGMGESPTQVLIEDVLIKNAGAVMLYVGGARVELTGSTADQIGDALKAAANRLLSPQYD